MTLAQLTLTSCGKLMLAPMTQAFIERSTWVSKCTTCPQACTPASVRPAHLNDEITWNHRPLDVERMSEAAQYLVGTHDFSAFRAGQCQAKSPIKELHHLRVTRHGKMIVLDIRASAFLHHMVRNIAGVLMTIGAGERPMEWMKEVLESRVRRSGGVTAHPFGLYLVQVEYRDEFELPERYIGPHFLTGFSELDG